LVFPLRQGSGEVNPLNSHSHRQDIRRQKPQLTVSTGIKSLHATLPDGIFYWGFCFLNCAFRKYMREKPTNATIIHPVY
jgi:hypothetical protein